MTQPAEAPPHRARIAAVVTDAIRTIIPALPVAEIAEDKHLKDLGADSVDRVEIILSIIDRLNLDEPMSSFSDIPDIRRLVDFLCARSQP